MFNHNVMRLLFSLLLSFLIIAPGHSFADNRNVVTGTFAVDGTCGQCKQRIEDAAYIKGVKSAEWDKKTHILTVKYDSTKTDEGKIQLAVAHAGHDAGNIKATTGDYDKLPNCCRYKSGIKEH